VIGTVLENRYEILELIGTGGMAEVYRAHDREEDRQVAVKMIKKEFCEDAQYMRRFERETRAMLTLECPNIVRAYAYGEYEGRSYIVMEYVEGLTLKEYLKSKGKLSPKAAVHITCRVLNALDAAHKGGYVHRDVKPQNVLISRDRTIKLTDFGIAKDTASITRTFDGNNVVGSVHYISPEQASGGAVGVESDLYSVGIMLYEMLVGNPPFDGDNSVQIALKHINETLVPPIEADPSISPALSDVIVNATAKDLAVRYSSAEELKRDLIRALREPESRFAKVEDAGPVRKADPEEQPKGKGKLWHIILPAVLMVALVLGMFLAWYFTMFGKDKNTVPKVPDVIGKTVAEATEVLKNREFGISVAGYMFDPDVEKGRICKQTPESGETADSGTVVEVWLSNGTTTVSMENLVGKTLEEATPILEKLNLMIESIDYEASQEPEGTIIRQSIPEGTELVNDGIGESIRLVISGSEGRTLVPMPDLMNITTPGGIRRVMEAYRVRGTRFHYSKTTKAEAGAGSTALVFSQNPQAGLPFVPSENDIDIYLYADYSRLCCANIDFSMPIEEEDTLVEVVMTTDYGDFVLFEEVFDPTENWNFRFTAGYLYEGTHECVVYRNGTEMFRFNADFVKRKD
jgi:serine/threonine-protein kinase